MSYKMDFSHLCTITQIPPETLRCVSIYLIMNIHGYHVDILSYGLTNHILDFSFLRRPGAGKNCDCLQTIQENNWFVSFDFSCFVYF